MANGYASADYVDGVIHARPWVRERQVAQACVHEEKYPEVSVALI